MLMIMSMMMITTIIMIIYDNGSGSDNNNNIIEFYITIKLLKIKTIKHSYIKTKTNVFAQHETMTMIMTLIMITIKRIIRRM